MKYFSRSIIAGVALSAMVGGVLSRNRVQHNAMPTKELLAAKRPKLATHHGPSV